MGTAVIDALVLTFVMSKQLEKLSEQTFKDPFLSPSLSLVLGRLTLVAASQRTIHSTLINASFHEPDPQQAYFLCS